MKVAFDYTQPKLSLETLGAVWAPKFPKLYTWQPCQLYALTAGVICPPGALSAHVQQQGVAIDPLSLGLLTCLKGQWHAAARAFGDLPPLDDTSSLGPRLFPSFPPLAFPR